MKKILLNVFIIITLSAGAQTGPNTCQGDGFGGNKRAIISALNPQIHAPNTVGEAPYPVYVSAMNSTATGTARPYEDVEYSWDFGDNSATGDFMVNHPVYSVPMSVNTDQKGPEGTYLYKTPGIYTITLTAKAWNGSNYITNTTTTIVTISAWSGHDRYFDASGGNDAADGLTAATAWKTWSALEDWLEGGDNRGALLKRGETFVATSSDKLVLKYFSGTRIGDYGTGAKPLVVPEAGYLSAIIRTNIPNGEVVRDFVVYNIKFDALEFGGSIFSGYTDATGTLERITFFGCEFKDSPKTLITTSGGNIGYKKYFLMWDCYFNEGTVPQPHGQGFGSIETDYVTVLGCRFSGGNGHPTFDHHMYPSRTDHLLLRWINFDTSVTRNFCMNLNAAKLFGRNMEYVLVDGCELEGSKNGIDFSNTHNDPAGSKFDYTIVQNCSFSVSNGSQGIALYGINILNITVRNNIFYNNNASAMDIKDRAVVYNVYQNIFYQSSAISKINIRLYQDQTGRFVDNYFVNLGVGQDYQFNGGPNANANGSTLSAFATPSNFIIDRNQYYHPNNPNQAFRTESGTYLDFAGWQALGYELNGSIQDPLWPDPDNGDFGCGFVIQNISDKKITNSSLNIFPNPASNSIFISNKIKIESLSIFDIRGRIVKKEISPNNLINISKLSSGIYLVKIVTKDDIYINKIIKSEK